MKAILPAADTFNGKMLDGEKEQIRALVIVDRKTGMQPVTVRVWMARSRNASVAYCSVWASGKTRHCAGHGRASGWGYHRASAALSSALSSAGIKLDTPINGVGEGAMRDACIAVAVALGYNAAQLVVVEV